MECTADAKHEHLIKSSLCAQVGDIKMKMLCVPQKTLVPRSRGQKRPLQPRREGALDLFLRSMRTV